MTNERPIQELAYGYVTEETPAEKLDALANRATSAAGRKLWKGWLAVAASGFGKGAIIAVIGLVAATALAFGLGAGAGNITTMTEWGLKAATVEQGVAIGASYMMHMLTHNAGLAAAVVGFGGLAGAVIDGSRHRKLTAAAAQEEARRYADARQQALGQQQALPVPNMQPYTQLEERAAALNDPDCRTDFCARERQRRAAPEQNPQVMR